jgi:hypothetical protein
MSTTHAHTPTTHVNAPVFSASSASSPRKLTNLQRHVRCAQRVLTAYALAMKSVNARGMTGEYWRARAMYALRGTHITHSTPLSLPHRKKGDEANAALANGVGCERCWCTYATCCASALSRAKSARSSSRKSRSNRDSSAAGN